MKNYYEEDQKLFEAVSSFKGGKQESYYVMYDLSIKYIYKIVHDIIKDYHETEDLVQETYLTIYNKINTLEDATKFYSWAGRIATNHTLRYIQKNKRDLLTLDSEDGAAEFAFEVATQDNEEFIPENIIMDKEKQRLIAQIIDGLSTEQKLAVQYFYYEEMSVTEIAETMGCAKGTILSRLNYARKSIKAAVVDLAENQGTKLYSLGALPLFRIVFMYSVERFILPASASGIVTEVGSALGVTATKGITAVEAAETAGATAVTGTATTVGATVTTEAAVGAGIETVAGAVAAGVTKGALGKLGASLGIKIATGVLTVGLLTTGGILLHNANTTNDSDVKDMNVATGATVGEEQTNEIGEEVGSKVTEESTPEPTPEPTAEPIFEDYVIEWKDTNLEAAMREETGIYDRDIMYSDVREITQLSVKNKGVSDISALSDLTNLTSLDLSYNSISDISALSTLTNLERLELNNNNISDISALGTLTNLTSLYLGYNGSISDISTLSSLTKLQTLDLAYNNISDISALSGLTKLGKLDLFQNVISDISALSALTNLTSLTLENNSISDISALSNLTKLKYLNLLGNSISDISVLGNMTKLESLFLETDAVNDISVLDNFPDLELNEEKPW